MHGKLLDGNDREFRPVYLLEDVEVGVVGDDVLGIGGHGAVNKLIVVGVGNGPNIPYTKGGYKVFFNDITGQFMFVEKTE